MEKGLDTGPIISQSQVLVHDDDTTGTLSSKLSIISANMLIDVLPRWIKGTINPRPQNSIQATYFKPIEKEAGEINWNLPAETIWRHVRAYNPWPTAFTRFNGRMLKILETSPKDMDFAAPIGSVVPLGQGCGVTTSSGILELRRLQIESKQSMSVSDFINGHRSFIGTNLPN